MAKTIRCPVPEKDNWETRREARRLLQRQRRKQAWQRKQRKQQ